MALALAALAGCHTPEEKALAKERVELIKLEGAVVDANPSCPALVKALGQFETTNSARVTTFNTQWKALPEAKRKALMKPLREESNPYFAKLTGPLIRCGAVFPVM